MAILSSYTALLPPILKEKYSDAFFIGAANDILEILSGERILRDLTYQKGLIVKYQKWITPPSNYRQANKLFSPTDWNSEFPFIEDDGKLMLTDQTVDEDDDPVQATAFTSSAVDSITVNVADLEKDELKDCLLVITSGTLTGNTYVISANDVSGASTTKIYYLHALSTALVATTQIAAANIVSSNHYIMLSYKGSFVEISAISDEIPIQNNHERRIMKAGLMMIGYERLQGPNGDMTKLWQGKFDQVIMKVRDEFLSGGNQTDVKSRRWIGMQDDADIDDFPDEED
jgi:hypothetical protein